MTDLKEVPALNGLVLAGGKSMRMGRDKSLLNYHGKPQQEYIYELLQPLCGQVFISCNAAQYAAIFLPKIKDHFPGTGPLGGLLSALRAAPGAAWLSVACDMPYVNFETLQHLIGQRNPARLATAFINSDDGLPEPLLTIWEPRAYPVLLDALRHGITSPRRILIDSDTALLNIPQPLALKNINDPVSQQALAAILQQNIDV